MTSTDRSASTSYTITGSPLTSSTKPTIDFSNFLSTDKSDDFGVSTTDQSYKRKRSVVTEGFVWNDPETTTSETGEISFYFSFSSIFWKNMIFN